MTDDPDLTTRWLPGFLESCVVAVLRPAPTYGYEIARRVESAGFERPKGGTLYPILARLERDGLVGSRWVEGDRGPGRKYYELTDRGRETADRISAEWETFSRQIATLLAEPVMEVRR